MNDAIKNQMQDRFQLETSLLRLRHQAEDNKAALRQAKFDLREAQNAQTLYSGSFRSFRDKLTGKKEETETALRHAVQKAESTLAFARRQKELLNAQLSELEAQLAALPVWDSLNNGSREWLRMEALLCAEALVPLLEETHRDLLERRNMISGSNVGKIYSYAEWAEVGSAPEESAEICKLWLHRLKSALEALGIPVPGHRFFDDPSYFLNSVTEFNRRDRLNEAIAQTEALQRLIPKFQKQLEE